MSPWNIPYLEQEIAKECRIIRRRFSNLKTITVSHELYSQQFQQLNLYSEQLVFLVGKKQADAMIHDLYRKAGV